MDLIGLVYFQTSRFCRVRASIHALFYTTMFYETLNNYFLLCHTNKFKHQVKIYQKCVDRERKNSLKIIQGCALAEPCGPWRLTLCPRPTTKSQIFHTNHMLGTLDFTVSEHWAPFNFPQSTALIIVSGLKCIKFWIFSRLSAVRIRHDDRHTNN